MYLPNGLLNQPLLSSTLRDYGRQEQELWYPQTEAQLVWVGKKKKTLAHEASRAIPVGVTFCKA